MTRKFLFIALVLALLAALAWSLPAAANDIPVSGALTADNGFVLYYGPANPASADLHFITQGLDTGDAWKTAVLFNTVNIPVGDYLYVVAWNLPDNAGENGISGSLNPQAWLGQFQIGNLPPVYSNLNQWQFIYTTSGNPSSGGNPNPAGLSQAVVASAILNGVWQTNTASSNNSTPNGTGIWESVYGSPISNISTDANWIWFDNFVGSSCPSGATSDPSANDGFAVFRLEVVPVPASVLLLGSGIMGLGLLGWRRKRS